MTRRLLLLVTLAAAACDVGDQGAISVRWRLVDKDTGEGFDPRDTGTPSGACLVDRANLTVGGCTNVSYSFTVHKVRVQVDDPKSGASLDVPDKYTVFDCRAREATTTFNIPIGTHSLSLCAFNPDLPDACTDGTTPPPAILQVKQAEITNLDVIEISVHPQLTGIPCPK